MNIDIGLPPLITVLIAVAMLAIISDFLLELFSIRFSLATGRWQTWLFNQVGQNLMGDFVIGLLLQFFSFRKKAFWSQLASLINVGSFQRRQILIMLPASFIGMGLSLFLLLGGSEVFGAGLAAVGLLVSLSSRDQLKDAGVALLSLGLFWVGIAFFDQALLNSTLNMFNFELGVGAWALFVVLATVLFRTPVGFLIGLALLNLFFGVPLIAIPFIFAAHSFLSFSRFYMNFLKKRRRLYFSVLLLGSCQVIQLLTSLLLIVFAQDVLSPLLKAESFLGSFQVVVASYAVFWALPLILLTPVFFLLSLLAFFDPDKEKRSGNQKILISNRRGSHFSIHLSLLLLRQEFKKFTTSVHTVFKLARETDHAEEELNQKFVRYQKMLIRVGEELKELCFFIGRQRSYRWQVQEIMSYYKIVNQLDLLVEDLGYVTELLRDKNQNEEWAKGCRFWLSLQLMIFESFLDDVLGVGESETEKIQGQIEKSYEILDRCFSEYPPVGDKKNNTQIFYRITESIGSLAL